MVTIQIQTLNVVGSVRHRQFQPLCLELARLANQVRHYSRPIEVPAPVDPLQTVTVVLQSWSDEYSRSEVSQIVGQHIFGRLYCCYAPACESDGRNRHLWPDAVRVSLRLAAQTILADLSDRSKMLPLTASPDEVFAHRSIRRNEPPINRHAAIISPDGAVRQSVTQILRDAGISGVSHTLLTGSETAVEQAVDCILHDLDPWGPWTETSLRHAAALYPLADVKGLASMPDAGLMTELADLPVSEIIPKLDAVNALLPALRRSA